MPNVTIDCAYCGRSVRVMQRPKLAPVRYCSRECANTRIGKAKIVDSATPERLRQMYEVDKLAIGDIAREFAVTHRTIKLLFADFGIPQRSIAEQKAVDLTRMSTEDRLAMTAASRSIITGRKRSLDDLSKRARTKQERAVLSGDEAEIMAAMNSCGLFPVPLYAVGKYNIDFAFPEIKLAVEYNGGNWHNLPKKIAEDERKAELLRGSGWTLLVFPRIAKRRRVDSGNARIELAALVAQVEEAAHRLTPPPA